MFNVMKTVLKRRLIFDPLLEPEPLQTGNRADLPSSGAPVLPLLHRRSLLLPEPLANTKGVGGVFVYRALNTKLILKV